MRSSDLPLALNHSPNVVTGKLLQIIVSPEVLGAVVAVDDVLKFHGENLGPSVLQYLLIRGEDSEIFEGSFYLLVCSHSNPMVARHEPESHLWRNFSEGKTEVLFLSDLSSKAGQVFV